MTEVMSLCLPWINHPPGQLPAGLSDGAGHAGGHSWHVGNKYWVLGLGSWFPQREEVQAWRPGTECPLVIWSTVFVIVQLPRPGFAQWL